MLRLAALTAAAALGVEAGAGGSAWTGADTTTAPFAVASPSAREPFLGVVFPEPDTNTRSILARLDPLSLRPVSPEVEIGEYHGAWSLSPDGTQVALAISAGVSLISPSRPLRERIGVMIVDLEAMRVIQEIESGGAARALAWLAPRRLVAALPGGTVLVDPRTGGTVKRLTGHSRPLASVRARDRIVMLFKGPYRTAGNRRSQGSAAVRVAVVDAHGRFRSVALDRVRLTFRGGLRWDEAGLAVDRAQGRAYVFAADAPVAEIDLRTLRVSYHHLDFLFLRPGALQGGSARPGKLLHRSRDAISLGERRVLVSGRDVVVGRGGKEAFVPAGAMLVDIAGGTWRALDPKASGAAFAAERLLAYGRFGVHGYTLGESRVFHLLEGRRVFDVQVAGELAYVHTARAVGIVDVRRGRIVADIVPRQHLIDVISARE
ncbi:MAG: hypothetical protein H0U82_02745 [Actinobacteria bacterium]|nr:hypothetical protein [Actinomycetota bacterium]